MYTLIFQFLQDFYKWFQNAILERFNDNQITMTGVIEEFSQRRQRMFLSALNNFRSTLSQLFDTPMNSFITETAYSMKTSYLDILDRFIATSYYYGPQANFKRLVSSMIIWRIPVGIHNLHCHIIMLSI